MTITELAPHRAHEPIIRKSRGARYCAECAARMITTRHPADYGNTACHTCRTENPVAIGHIDGETRDERQLRAMTAMGEIKTPEAATPKPAQPAKKSCPFYHAIKQCQAVAAEFGLNFRHEEGRRAAASLVFNHCVETCKELDGAQWQALADEIRLWGLRWNERDAWYDSAAVAGRRY